MSMTPPSLPMFVLTMSMPTPRPESSPTSLLVVKPGMKIEVRGSRAWLSSLDLVLRRRGRAGRAASMSCCVVDALAVVLDLDDDVVALLEGVERDRADRRLADRLALDARLDAVIDGVADHVHERIAELLDDELVDLGLGAGDDEVHLLVGLAADLADDARELVEDLPERHHAHLEDAALHCAEVALERRGAAGRARCRSRAARASSRTRSVRRAIACARSRARPRCSSGDRACGCRRAPSASTERSETSAAVARWRAGWRNVGPSELRPAPCAAGGHVAGASTRARRRLAGWASGSPGSRSDDGAVVCAPRATRHLLDASVALVAEQLTRSASSVGPARPSGCRARSSRRRPPRPSAGSVMISPCGLARRFSSSSASSMVASSNCTRSR